MNQSNFVGTLKLGILIFFIAGAVDQVSAAEAAENDKFAQVRGFKVEISGSSGKEVDTAWESVSAGDLVVETISDSSGSRRGLQVGTLTLSNGDATNDAALSHIIYLNNCKPNGCYLRLRITPAIEVAPGKLVAGDDFEFSSCAPAHDQHLDSNNSRVTFRCVLNSRGQKESRRFQTLSNASKARHDIALNAIRNMK